MNESTALHLIQMLRLDILAHSYIYYIQDDNVIADWEWDGMLRKLVTLQMEYPEIGKEARYAEEFMEYESVSGCSHILTEKFLEAHPEVIRRAQELKRDTP